MTTIFSTSLFLVAGICAGFGILYLFVGWRRARDTDLHITFAVFALSYSGATLAAAWSYVAADAAGAIAANRLVALFAVPAYIALLWFVSIYTHVRARPILWSLSAVFALLGLANLFAPNLLHDLTAQVMTLTLPWGETVSLLDESETPLVPVLVLAQLATIGFVVYALIRQYRRGERRMAMILGIGMLWFVLTLIVDILVETDVIDFVFLTDFGFLGFAMAISLQMANSVIETEHELALYQDQLTMLVEQRTTELQQANERLLAQERIAATAEERRRLSSELHDSVTQTLYSVSLVAAALPRLLERNIEEARSSAQHLRNMTIGALAEMRTLLYELRPDTLANARLGTLLQQAADVFTGRTHIPVEIIVQGDPRPTPEIKLACYRIAQEAMNNAAKHAAATRLTLELQDSDDGMELRVEDNGRGFEPQMAAEDGLGLSIMKERAMSIDAELEISSAEGRGTTITLRRPRDGYHA